MVHPWTQGIPTKAIHGPRDFCQVLVTGFAKTWAGLQDCAVVNYSWGGKHVQNCFPGKGLIFCIDLTPNMD